MAAGLVLLVLGLMLPAATSALAQTTYTADVVLFDTGMIFNRLGAQNPNWMMYALRRDVVIKNPVDAIVEPTVGDGIANTLATGDDVQVIAQNDPATAGAVIIAPGPDGILQTTPTADDVIANVPELTPLTQVDANLVQPGNVALRPDKRPRPLVLRIPADSNLMVEFQNLLTPVVFQPPVDPDPRDAAVVNCPPGPNQARCLALLQNDNQVNSQAASFHAAGLQVVNGVADDGTYVGANIDWGTFVQNVPKWGMIKSKIKV
jgi:hypothetical protein